MRIWILWNDSYIRREDKYVDMDCDSDAEGGKGGRILRKRTLHGISPSYVPEQTVHGRGACTAMTLSPHIFIQV